MPNIYVAGYTAGSGATTVAASLAAVAQAVGKRAGYCKPVSMSAKAGTPDADAMFCQQALGLAEAVNVIAATGEALEQGLGTHADAARRAVQAAAQGKDVTVIDGLPASGRTAVASAELANLADARVVVVVWYQHGMEATVVAGVKERFGERLAGVLVNAVPAHATREAAQVFTPALRAAGIAVLGLIPEDRLLLGFTVAELSAQLGAEVLSNQEGSGEIVEQLLIGANVVDSSEYYYQRVPNKALITRADRPDLLWNALDENTRCVIVTGGKQPIPYVLDKAAENGVPVIVSPKGTMDTVTGLEGLASAATFHHPKKLARYVEMLQAYANVGDVGV